MNEDRVSEALEEIAKQLRVVAARFGELIDLASGSEDWEAHPAAEDNILERKHREIVERLKS